MSRYLVTGCAGFIGSHLAEVLVADGHTVVGVDNFSDYYAERIKRSNLSALSGNSAFSLVEKSLVEANQDHITDAIDGAFHLAAQPGVRGSWGDTFTRYVADNIIATQRLFEACAARGVRVVYASSSSVYGNAEAYPTDESVSLDPVSPYGVTKQTCERLAAAYASQQGLAAVGMRYFTVYGPRQRPDMAYTRIAEALLNGTSFTVYGTGQQSRDVTYVADIVAATIACMAPDVSGPVYNVGGGNEVSLAEAIRTFESAAGASLDVDYVDAVAGDVRRTAGSTQALRRDTGWSPRTDINEGIRRHLEWARAAMDKA